MTFPHLRLPNDIVDRLAQLHLNGTQWQVLWAIFRQTLCWQKKGTWENHSFPISVGDLSQATTLDQFQIKRELGLLVKWNLVIRSGGGGRGNKPLTHFNLDYSTWQVPNSSYNATLSPEKEKVAEALLFGTQNGGKDSFDNSINSSGIATVNDLKGSESARKTVAEKLPITRESATLSVPSVASPKETIKKHRKKHIYKETGDLVVPDWIDKECWNGYLEMRQLKNKKPTRRALELVIISLTRFKEQGQDPNEVLNLSTVNSWTGVYPVKGGSNAGIIANRGFSPQKRTSDEQRRSSIPSHLSDVSDLPDL